MNQVSFDELFASAKTSVKSLVKGEFLFQKGDPSTHLYMVLDGCVRLVRYSREGDAIIMHSARTGDSVAEASLFSDTYHCNAEAMTPSTVACYDKKSILGILRDSPERSMACIALYSREVRNLRALLEVRAIRSARERVLLYLLLQADPQTMAVRVSGTIKEMAQDLAITHETLYRTLANLEKEGKIARTGSLIKIR